MKLAALIGPSKRASRTKSSIKDKNEKGKSLSVPDKISQRQFYDDDAHISVGQAVDLSRSSSSTLIHKRKQTYQPKALDANMVAIRTGKRGRPRLVTKEEAKAYSIDVESTSQFESKSQKNIISSDKQQHQGDLDVRQQQQHTEQERFLMSHQSQLTTNNNNKYSADSQPSHISTGNNLSQRSSMNFTASSSSINSGYALLCDHFQYFRACPECKIDLSGYKYYDVPALKEKVAKVERRIELLQRKAYAIEGQEYYTDYVNFDKLGYRIDDVDTYRELEDFFSEEEEKEDSDDDEDFEDDDEDHPQQ